MDDTKWDVLGTQFISIRNQPPRPIELYLILFSLCWSIRQITQKAELLSRYFSCVFMFMLLLFRLRCVFVCVCFSLSSVNCVCVLYLLPSGEIKNIYIKLQTDLD